MADVSTYECEIPTVQDMADIITYESQRLMLRAMADVSTDESQILMLRAMADKCLTRSKLHLRGRRSWKLFHIDTKLGGLRSEPIDLKKWILDLKKWILDVVGNVDAACVVNTPRSKFSSSEILLISLDGTIYAMDKNSGKIVWSFSSGSSPASHQTFSYDKNDDNSTVVVSEGTDVKEDQFLFYGKDWNLDTFNKRCGTKSLPKAPAKRVNGPVQLSPDGSLIHGSKAMTTFLMDAKTGNIINRCDSRVPLPTDEADMCFPVKSVVSGQNIGNSTESEIVGLSSMKPIIITQTDYILWSYKENTRKVQWKLSISEFDAIGDVFSGSTSEVYQDKFIFHQSYMFEINHDKKSILSLPPVENMDIELLNEKNKNGVFSNRLKNTCEVEKNCLAEFKNVKIQTDQSVPGSGWLSGRLFVSDSVIDNGSNGTTILEGRFDGRNAAVKCIVTAYDKAARKGIENLIESDQYPNIVRYYGVETDSNFVYVALERCNCSLSDFIMTLSKSVTNDMHTKSEATNPLQIKKIKQVTEICKKMNINLTDNGRASQQMLNLMRDVVSGLSDLHDLGIIHGDLKPQNILISAGNGLCAKLSDMGISKRLANDASSLGRHATGIGSSGWRAPEQLLGGRQTRAVDLFNLGCVLFFCITGGKHPFGAEYERDGNIVKSKCDLSLIEDMPEAYDLVTRLLDSVADQRPTATEVLQHPFFWSSEKRLSFLREASDRLKNREKQSDLLQALKSVASLAIGGTWDAKLDSGFLDNIVHYRGYKFDSVRDLLRVIRNKSNHYWEIPNPVQELLGTFPEGFENYFRSRFPRLLIEVYKVFSQHCFDEECFKKYFRNCTI